MEAELTRLKLGQWFLDAFFRHAHGCHVMVDESKPFLR
jgi:hypothetical protein